MLFIGSIVKNLSYFTGGQGYFLDAPFVRPLCRNDFFYEQNDDVLPGFFVTQSLLNQAFYAVDHDLGLYLSATISHGKKGDRPDPLFKQCNKVF